MTVSLKPSFFRSAAAVLIGFSIGSVVAYFSQGYFEHCWWTFGYAIGLLLPFSIMTVVVWFAFVPVLLEFSATHLTIQLHFRNRQSLTWEELKYYGRGHNVFLIQFTGQEAFQIFAHAYPRTEWKQFKTFLESRFPTHKASGWFGPYGFKLGQHK